jgi:hypothetical protein
MSKREEILIVDGYNVIGTVPLLNEIKKRSFEEARDTLIDWLTEYQAYSGMRVIIVFDAHQVKGGAKRVFSKRVEVQYSGEEETADERIEQLVTQLQSRKRQIYVATSDYLEQRVTFGKGALRISARELWKDMEGAKKAISHQLASHSPDRTTLYHLLDDEVKDRFEKLRRKK